MKNIFFKKKQNMENPLIFGISGKNGARHQIREVETALGTKSQVWRTKLSYFLQNLTIIESLESTEPTESLE